MGSQDDELRVAFDVEAEDDFRVVEEVFFGADEDVAGADVCGAEVDVGTAAPPGDVVGAVAGVRPSVPVEVPLTERTVSTCGEARAPTTTNWPSIPTRSGSSSSRGGRAWPGRRGA